MRTGFTPLVNPGTNIKDISAVDPARRELIVRRAGLLEQIGDAARRADTDTVLDLAVSLSTVRRRLQRHDAEVFNGTSEVKAS